MGHMAALIRESVHLFVSGGECFPMCLCHSTGIREYFVIKFAEVWHSSIHPPLVSVRNPLHYFPQYIFCSLSLLFPLKCGNMWCLLTFICLISSFTSFFFTGPPSSMTGSMMEGKSHCVVFDPVFFFYYFAIPIPDSQRELQAVFSLSRNKLVSNENKWKGSWM